MSSCLEESIGLLEGEVSDSASNVARADIDEAGELQAVFGEKLRKLAAAHWIINKSTEEFVRGLKSAADCRLEFVKKPGALEHYYYSVNSVESMENAIISGADSLATDLAKASVTSAHQHGHLTDWAYHKVLGAVLLGSNGELTSTDSWRQLTDNPHSIYVHPAKCIKALLSSDDAGFRAAFSSWCQDVDVFVPDEMDLEEADQNESQARVLIRELDSSVFFAGLAVIKLAMRVNIELDSGQLTDCGLEQLSRATQ